MTADFLGKVALVTGAGRGLGFAIARALIGAGATVAVNDRTPETVEAAIARLGSTRAIPAPECLQPFLLRDVVLGDVAFEIRTWTPKIGRAAWRGLLGFKPLPSLGVAARSQTGRNAARLGKCCSPPSTVSRAKRAVSSRRFRSSP